MSTKPDQLHCHRETIKMLSASINQSTTANSGDLE